MQHLKEWIAQHKIDEIECLVPDMNGIMRGKILPSHKFLADLRHGLRLPEVILSQMVTGKFIENSSVIDDTVKDIIMVPDETTLTVVPWYDNPTAQIICDIKTLDGDEIPFAPRTLLRNMIALFQQKGLAPIVAPELEFYLIEKNLDPDYPLNTPVGLSGRQEAGHQAYGIESLNEYDPIIDLIYDYCEAMSIDVDTTTHESGPAQIEFNFNHGDALKLADQVFLFKRAVRKAAIKHNIFATFMAKPYQKLPGNAMHIHQSLIDINSGRNVFATATGKDSKMLHHYIGGLRKYIPAAFPLFAPTVNSYRRITPYSDAPINTHWGKDNRTVGLRVPDSSINARRIENRVIGADANPYLAMAGTLACGYLGIEGRISPKNPVTGDAYKLAFTLPRSLHESLNKFSHSKPLRNILGDKFVYLFCEVKYEEYEEFHQVISSWEREFLLLNV